MTEFVGVVCLDRSDDPKVHLNAVAGALEGVGLGPIEHSLARSACFALRRRILAPEDRLERQLSEEAGGMTSLWDGRLDNRAELVAMLGLDTRDPGTIADGDIVRAAYARWGEDAVTRLIGDFAWALWDMPAGKLMLARDPSRLRSLYYCVTERYIAFATAYAPLLALPGPRRQPDIETLARMMLAAPDASGRTLYRGIYWVGSAERVTITRQGKRKTRFWEPTERPMLRLRSDDAYLEAARSVFETAVRDRLRTIGPIATSITGGLDSSAVAATAARLSTPAVVHGYCMVPRAGSAAQATANHYPDETPFVRAIAARYANLEVQFVDQGFALDDPDRLIPHMQIAAIAPGNLLWFAPLCERAAKMGVTTMLDGAMGNLTFSAAGEDPATVLWRKREWSRLGRLLTTPSGQYRTLRRLAGSIRSRLRPERGPERFPLAGINPEFARSHDLVSLFEQDGSANVVRQGGDALLRNLRYVLLRSRAQMEQGAALRRLLGVTQSDPFSDRRVIDFVLSLPPEQFRRGGWTRLLARRTFADRLPRDVVANRRRGLQDTEWHWRLISRRERLEETVERLTRSELASGLLDLPSLRQILRELPEDPAKAEQNRRRYGRDLEFSLHLGQFLAWVESGMAKPNSPAFP